MNKQHSILFLYSLAPEIKAELAARGSSTEGYIERIRHTNGVEVRDLTAEALANADNYSVIIIVAHHNETLDALILQDGTGLSLDALTNAIPKTFAGLLDISSCGTKALAKAVKERCPSCHVQAAASTAGLELRLFLYANLLPFITAHPDIDYHAAYVRALNEIKQAQQGQQDLKDTTKLGGQKATSAYSPFEVKRKATVPIHVFIHYDSEQEVVQKKAPKNTEIHIYSESLRGVHVGDELTIRLSFIDNGETHHLRIIDGPDELIVRVEEEITHHIFKVKVDAEYSAPNFACNINFSKGNEMISSLPVFIDVTDYDAPIDAASSKSQPNGLELASFHPSIEEMKQYRTQNRKEIIDQLLDYVDLGDWKEYETIEKVKKMLLTILGDGEVQLKDNEAKMSEDLWYLLENGRGNRVEIVWQNLVGYFDERKLFRKKGSPALNKDFFDNTDGYSNIDKGRPSRDANGHPIPVANMSKGFFYILDLLDTYYREIFQM